MGEPLDPPWGPETAKAIENFPISGQPLPWELISALIEIKRAAAIVNARKRVIPKKIADAIVASADELLADPKPEWFPVDVFQTGSGTSTNMNVNEVLAHMASARLGQPVHPNDHVNASQSSNDVFPSAIHVAVAAAAQRCEGSLESLSRALYDLASAHRDTVKAGRTHLQDAAPISFFQEAEGWSDQALNASLWCYQPDLLRLPIGGSAVGTGLNVPRGFGNEVAALLTTERLEFEQTGQHFAAQSSIDVFVAVSGGAKAAALALFKIAGDLRLLASGPNAGFAEITLPELQKGSSIMPGKVNPVIPEAVQQVCCQVVGNDAAITFASTLSTLQLNTAMPVVARNLLESLRLLTAAATVLAEKCIAGITVDVERMRRYAESSPAVVTALVPLIGYDRAAQIAKQAEREGRAVREVVADDKSIDQAAAAKALDLLMMADPHRRRPRPNK